VGYTTDPEIKSALGFAAGDLLDDPIISASRAAAEATVEAYCGRVFHKTDEVEVRLFSADLTTLCTIDDLATLDGLKVEVYKYEEWVDVTSLVSPGTAYGNPKTGWPYTELWCPVGQFVRGRNLVRVTGIWGWNAVPAAVKQAALVMAVRLVKRRDAPFGMVAGGLDLGPMRISKVDPDLEALLGPLRRGDATGTAI
jgi:hypothetical protein